MVDKDWKVCYVDFSGAISRLIRSAVALVINFCPFWYRGKEVLLGDLCLAFRQMGGGQGAFLASVSSSK